MLAPWAIEESADVNLQDKRLNQRMAEVLSQLGGSPKASIPSACGTWAETLAAYRFFDNPKVSFGGILEPHIEASFGRIKSQSVVVVAQDTTEVELTRPERVVSGAGPLADESRWGAFLHPMHAFSAEGTPLGTVYAQAWSREKPPLVARTKKQKEYDRKHTPFEDKESYRWFESLRQAEEIAEAAAETQVVCVADSEADIYELLGSPKIDRVDWIVRGCQNRALSGEQTLQQDAAPAFIRETVLKTECRFTKTINIGKRKSRIKDETRKRKQSRPAREAEMEVRAASVTLRAPWRCDKKLTDTTINVVLVTEVDVPQGEEPIEWILLTSLPIDTIEAIKSVIQYYTVRWMIEVYFRTLKSFCRIEERQFETLDRVLNAIAIYMIIAWRSLYVCRIAREMPDDSCEIIFEPEEWKAVHSFVHMEMPPENPPSLKEMVRAIGQLGGFINRTHDDQPGPLTVAAGLQRTHDIARCWLAFGPDTNLADP